MFMTFPRMIGFKKYLVNGFSGGGSPPPNYENVKFFFYANISSKKFLTKNVCIKKSPSFGRGIVVDVGRLSYKCILHYRLFLFLEKGICTV